MSDIAKLPSLGLSRCIYVIDSIVCKKIHNPVISSAVVGAILVSVAVKQYSTWSPFNTLENSGYLPDFLQNVMNLLFILRFPSNLKKLLRITSNKYVECVLFAALNVVAIVSLSSLYPFLSLMSLAFRVLLWVLVLCPYVILALNLAELAWENLKVSNQEPEKKFGLETPRNDGLLGLIIDANNSFMAIFIAQSFTAINLELPFYENTFVPSIYRYAAYSLKFYLIYCFVLYEIVVVIYDIHNVKSYAELYNPVQLGATKNTWVHRFNSMTSKCLLATTIFTMIYDLVMILLAFSHQYI